MFLSKKDAPELINLEEKAWINSKPLSLEQLRGKVVLLDFWAYSCVNCLRTLPFLKEMWKKYKDKRLVIIGVHTPEFEFEKLIGNVKYAVNKHGLEYPVVSDPEGVNWRRYGNQYWPRSALIDSEGKIIGEHVGESGYDEIEEKIIEQLHKLGEINDPEAVERIEEKRRSYSYDISQETYTGSLRSRGFGSGIACTKDECDEYVDSGKYQKDVINLQGDWKQEKEYVEYLGEDGKGWLAYQFYAREVNAVMDGVGEADIILDGRDAGKVKVEGAEMYNVVNTKEYKSGLLKIVPFNGLKVYAFTFG